MGSKASQLYDSGTIQSNDDHAAVGGDLPWATRLDGFMQSFDKSQLVGDGEGGTDIEVSGGYMEGASRAWRNDGSAPSHSIAPPKSIFKKLLGLCCQGFSLEPGLTAMSPQDSMAEPSAAAVPVRSFSAWSSMEAPMSKTPVKRWSADAWMLQRGQGGQLANSAGGVPVYGASQAGAVLRYTIAPRMSLAPQVHLRYTKAMEETGEQEVAIGASIRPFGRSVPIRAVAEFRRSQVEKKAHYRPALLAYTEFKPQKLPMGFEMSPYIQAGYVGGKVKSPFVDGLIRAEKQIVSFKSTRVHLGVGVWGAAQKGAWRVDAGPTIAVTTPIIDKVYARASVDWRQRVAGNAEPGSGPAMTVAIGF